MDMSACEAYEPQDIEGFKDYGHIALAGVTNGRDLGGMPTEDGRRIKANKLVRSSDLHDATDEDAVKLLGEHDVRTIVDFRTDDEIKDRPGAASVLDNAAYEHLPVFKEEAIGITVSKNVFEDVKALMKYADAPFSRMEKLYTVCVLEEEGIEAYRTFLHGLLDAEGATLWHCTQGKDRTGIGAVLVEHVLGVPWAYMRDDYLATNYFVKDWARGMRHILEELPIAHALEQVVQAYAYANTCYFDTLMNAVEDKFGSLDGYIKDALGFGDQQIAEMRAKYLEG